MDHLSLTGKRWALRDSGLTTDSVVSCLLAERGIEALGAGEILDDFGHDSGLFRDYPKAADRIRSALKTKETVGIFGDYDCDGITSSALLTRFFKRHATHPIVRLPHRLKEGYGLTLASIDEFTAANVTLLITVDTGVTALAPITKAVEHGIDVIVLDHHTLPETLPPALAIIHPEIVTSTLDSSPCGAGIAWSVIRGMQESLGLAEWDDRNTDVALAGIGTVADLVELKGGNRTLTHAGLTALSQITTGPLAMLCMQAGLSAPYTSRDVGFRLSPRINAAGRMADPHIALHALLGDMPMLLQLDALNRARQDIVRVQVDELLPQAATDDAAMLCYLHEESTPGICGLLAGKLCESRGRPSMVAARAGEICVASLRSIPGYDVTAGLARCRDLLLSYGGHAMAAGCTFRRDVFEDLRQRLRADAAMFIRAEDLTPTIGVDAEIALRDVTETFIESLGALEPFGQGNPEPRFLIRNVTLENTRCVGKDSKHLQASAGRCKVIGFGLGEMKNHIFHPVDLLCKLGIDTWNNIRKPQLFLEDMRIAERTLVANSKSQAPSLK